MLCRGGRRGSSRTMSILSEGRGMVRVGVRGGVPRSIFSLLFGCMIIISLSILPFRPVLSPRYGSFRLERRVGRNGVDGINAISLLEGIVVLIVTWGWTFIFHICCHLGVRAEGLQISRAQMRHTAQCVSLAEGVGGSSSRQHPTGPHIHALTHTAGTTTALGRLLALLYPFFIYCFSHADNNVWSHYPLWH